VRNASREVEENDGSPNSSPPSSVGLVMLELSGEEERDQSLVESSLNGDGSENSEDGVRRVPSLEEPLRTRKE